MKEADLVLYLFDVVEETRNELEAAQLMIQQHNPNYLLVGNKTDILGKQEAENKFSGDDILFISARSSHHIDVLKDRLVDKIIQGNVQSENTIITNARHYAALRRSTAPFWISKQALYSTAGDLLALDIRVVCII